MRSRQSISPRLSTAFTLLELLVVVSIIMILASLLLPAMTGSMSKAKQVQCLNQLRQIGLGMESFAHDHGDRFPMQLSRYQGGSMEANGEVLWANKDLSFSPRHFIALSNEIVSPKLVLCPADRTRRAALSFASMTRSNISYWVNIRAQPGSSVQALAGDWNVASDRTNGNTAELRFTAALHKTRGNVVYADGHVELRQVLTLALPPPSNLPGIIPPKRPPETGGHRGTTVTSSADGNQALGMRSAAGNRVSGNRSAIERATNGTAQALVTPSNGLPLAEDIAKVEVGAVKPLTAEGSRSGTGFRKGGKQMGAMDSAPSEVQTGGVTESPDRKKRVDEADEEISLLATMRTAATWLLWLLLIVALVLMLERYLSRRSRGNPRRPE